MRLLEIGLIMINFSLLFWALITNWKGVRSYYALAVSYGLILAQIWVEGARWEMIPAYVTPLLLTTHYYFVKRRKGSRRKVRVAVQAGLLSVFFLVSILLPTMLPVFSFEKMTGPYSVGTTTYHWVDEQRREPYSNNPADKRELMVQFWYPTIKRVNLHVSPYLQNARDMTAAISTKMMDLPAFTLNNLELVQSRAWLDAQLSDKESRYPVLIFSHGMNGYRNQNTFQVEELASHGYIVVGIDYAYESAASMYPDGKVALSKVDRNLTSNSQYESHIPLWTADATFVLNQLEKLNQYDTAGRFAGKMDLDRVGMLGHSFGGAVTLQMIKNDLRVKAAVSMDGGFYGPSVSEKGLGKPLLMMYSDETYSRVMTKYEDVAGKLGNVTREAFEAPRKEYIEKSRNALAGGGLSILIPGSKHASFSDLSLFSPMLGLSSSDPRRDHRIVNAFSVAFFDHYLKGKSDSTLQSAAVQYPDVHFTVNE
ncbi:alpha/beta hydrolase family protein [Paenibacillus sp. KN14-4R]|uniref:alpha/beta hydrolase family protein n=1 Tax=Paenibacillus sp. KN14-4R TaxID=3445773 RepID=UPI003F9EE0CD